MKLSVLHFGREELSVEVLLELLPSYLADVAPQHPLSSLPPGGALSSRKKTAHYTFWSSGHFMYRKIVSMDVNHIWAFVGFSMDPSKVLGLYFLKSLKCLASVDS